MTSLLTYAEEYARAFDGRLRGRSRGFAVPKSLSHIVTASIGFAALSLFAQGAFAANAVPNPSFELNQGWTSSDSFSGYSTAQKRTGARSMRLENNGSSTNHNVTYSNIPIPGVTKGQEYEFTIYVRAQNVAGEGAGGKPLTVLRWKNAANANLTGELYDWAPYGTYNFRPLRVNFQAPANAAKLNVGLRSWYGCLTGTTYWDDVLLVPRVVPGRGALQTVYQAETANTKTGGVVRTLEPDFTGTGYFDVTVTNAVLQWNNVVGGGNRVVAARYSSEALPMPMTLFVNGVNRGVKNPIRTGRRGSYATENWTVNLPSGNNTVRLLLQRRSGSEKLAPLVDRLEVYSVAP